MVFGGFSVFENLQKAPLGGSRDVGLGGLGWGLKLLEAGLYSPGFGVFWMFFLVRLGSLRW